MIAHTDNRMHLAMLGTLGCVRVPIGPVALP